MKRFVYTILLFISIPLIILVGLYIWTDPFRCIYAFDINDVDATNREYLSTELFLRNNTTYHYNSFILSSSRGCGMNTYQWKQYLQEGAQPFLFQAWSETVTGIDLKLEYLSEHQIPIDNALILIDIPGTFKQDQLPHEALSLKHYIFTGHSKFEYNAVQFWNFIQKPSLWGQSIQKRLHGMKIAYESDTITNDWEASNKDNYAELPPQDSLRNCTEMTRRTFFENVAHSDNVVVISKPLINGQFEERLHHIRTIFDTNKTDYHIIITPAPCYTNLAINPNDLKFLQDVFGEGRVHDYSGKNAYTEDYNNFSDPAHFGLRVGYMIVEDIYVTNKQMR